MTLTYPPLSPTTSTMTLPAFKSTALLDAITRFEDKLCTMVKECTGDVIPNGEVDDWLNIVVSEVSFYLPVKADMLKSEINDLLQHESAVMPTFDPFLPLAQASDTMIAEGGTHFPADPFIAVILHYFPPSKVSKLKLKLKVTIPLMTVGNHIKRWEDLERLNTAAMAGLGPNTSLATIHPKATKATTSQHVNVKVAPVMGKPNAGVSGPSGATTVVQHAAPTVKEAGCAKGKGVEQAQALKSKGEGI